MESVAQGPYSNRSGRCRGAADRVPGGISAPAIPAVWRWASVSREDGWPGPFAIPRPGFSSCSFCPTRCQLISVPWGGMKRGWFWWRHGLGAITRPHEVGSTLRLRT